MIEITREVREALAVQALVDGNAFPDPAVASYFAHWLREEPLPESQPTITPERDLRSAESKALNRAAGSLIDWEVMYGREPATPTIEHDHQIAAWLSDRADAIQEGREI